MGNRQLEDADYTYMQQAIQQAELGKTPFGCVIVQYDKIISEAFNTVSVSHDPSAHAEINAIRKACQQLQTPYLSQATLYTTGEPCPMCMSAILYAKIQRVVFSASIPTIARFMPQISMSSTEIAAQSCQSIILMGPFMEERCITLLQKFS